MTVSAPDRFDVHQHVVELRDELGHLQAHRIGGHVRSRLRHAGGIAVPYALTFVLSGSL